MRTQILLAEKMLLNEELIENARANYPQNIITLNQSIVSALTTQKGNIITALAAKSTVAKSRNTKDKSFDNVIKWIREDNLFKKSNISINIVSDGQIEIEPMSFAKLLL